MLEVTDTWPEILDLLMADTGHESFKNLFMVVSKRWLEFCLEIKFSYILYTLIKPVRLFDSFLHEPLFNIILIGDAPQQFKIAIRLSYFVLIEVLLS